MRRDWNDERHLDGWHRYRADRDGRRSERDATGRGQPPVHAEPGGMGWRRRWWEASRMLDRNERPGIPVAASTPANPRNSTRSSCAISWPITASMPLSVDVIGFHGQTVLHRAEEQLTVQLGDGALLAKLTRTAAKQMGRRAAENILHRVAGEPTGRSATATTATSRRSAARRRSSTSPCPSSARCASAASPAWLFWLFAHIYFLIGFRNRLIVMVDWAWAYFTYERGARVVAEPEASRAAPPLLD